MSQSPDNAVRFVPVKDVVPDLEPRWLAFFGRPFLAVRHKKTGQWHWHQPEQEIQK